MTRIASAQNPAKWLKLPISNPGQLALYVLMVLSWLLIILARTGSFHLWPVALPLLILAVSSGLYAWWRAERRDRWVVAGIVLAGAWLYTPPAEHIPLFGDAAIYPNTGALVARTGSLTVRYEPLADLSPESRTLFYVSAEEQLSWLKLHSYKGLVYGAYYLTDLEQLTLRASRPPLVESLFALFIRLVGIRAALYLTGIFAVLSLVMLYTVGQQTFQWQAALGAVVLLGVSYPQVYFGRAPYAEIFGQFWVLVGLYFAVRWLTQYKPCLLVSAFCAWITAWAGRGEALLLLGAVGLLLLYAMLHHDRRSLFALIVATPLMVALVILGTNQPYASAQWELYVFRWPWLPYIFLMLVVGLLLAMPLFWVLGQPIMAHLRRFLPVLHGAIFLVSAFILLWATVPNPLRVAGITRDYQEVVWFSSYYLTPLFFWLALAGLGWLLWRGYNAAQFLLLFTLLGVASIFFFRYTTAGYYPFALRRLTSEVFPLLALMVGVALSAGWLPRRWRPVQWAVGAVAIVWMLTLSWPVLQQHEAAGSLAFAEEFHHQAPANAVLIFEQQDSDSWVGWLAAPLYSLYGDTVLLLDSDTPDPVLLAQAVTELASSGRTVYLVSQHNPLPVPLLPPGYQATLAQQTHWHSTLIGQTRDPYPPPYWEYDHPVYLFQLQRLP